MQALEQLISSAQALIFDCDGTLVDTPGLYATAWKEAFANAGHDMSAEWYLERAGMSESVLLKAFEAAFGVHLDHDRTVADVRRSLSMNIETVQQITPVSDIARRCHGQKKMAVASGGPQTAVLPCLRATDLLSLFDTVVTIEDVAHPKPAPDLFFEAAKRLGVAPSHCLVFEDSPQGIQAAVDAGMEVIDVRHLTDEMVAKT